MAASDVTCGFCLSKNEQMVDPKELACGHIHCSPCLLGRKEAYNVVECPSPSCKHVYSEDIQQLPNADLGVETSQVKCDNCEEDAVIYCTHNLCRKRFCRKHKQLHAEFHKDHKTVGVKEYHLKSAKHETRRCEVHTSEELIAGCRSCRQFLCLQCLEDHTACEGGPHKMATLKTLSGEARETLASLRDRAEKRKTELVSVIKQNEEKLSDHSEEIQKTKKMLEDTRDEELEAIRKTYAIRIEELQKEYDQNEAKFVEFRNETVEAEISYLTREAQMITGTLNGAHEVDTIVKSRESQKRLATVIGDQLPTWDVPDKTPHSDDAVQSLAENPEPPVNQGVEFSEGQCFGKGNVFVLPRLQKKLLEHFKPDELFNHLFAETGLNVNPNSWLLTGYLFQLKLAEDCLKRLEKDADNSEHQEREKRKSKKKAQANPTEEHSLPSAQSPDTEPHTQSNALRAEDQPEDISLPDSDTETPSVDEEAENPIPKKAKADESRDSKASGQSMAYDRRFKASKSKFGTSYVYDVEEEFDQFYYEFVTTVLKAKFDDRVTKKFCGTITQKTSPKDSRMILVNIRSFRRHQSEDMMEALNSLYLETMRKLHSNIIKFLYDGDKRKLAKALIEELPKVYPGEQFIARLVTYNNIRIIGYLQNYDHDEHVVKSFVIDYKKRNPAPQQSYAKTSDIRLSNGATVRVIKGDLTRMKCDAIVSSSGPDLAHRCGVSNAIALACGQKFTIDGRRYVERHGEIPIAGTFTQAAAGRLQQLYGVSYVIHAIGPSPRQPGDINTLIVQTVLNALTEADTLKCRSVALPAICSGRMGVPLSTCANCYCLALDMFSAKVPTPVLKEINFVADDMQIVLEIDLAFKQLAEKNVQVVA